MAVGQLDMLVAQMGQGAAVRLVMREVEALTWAAGTPIPLGEIARDQVQARTSTNLEALQTARWAMRRLRGEGALEDLRGFLALHHTSPSERPAQTQLRLTGAAFDEAAREFQNSHRQMAPAHAFVQAAFGRSLWGMMDLSPEDDQIEGAVWAARHMAQGCAALTFVPIARAVRQMRGPGANALSSFLEAIEQGAIAAKSELQRLKHWQQRAHERTASLKGNNAAKVINALVEMPVCSASMIQHATTLSRDTAERILAKLETLGLTREITGATRFRAWTCAYGPTPPGR